MSKFIRMTDLDLKGKRVLIRADLNVPVQDGKVTSDARIAASMPTIVHALKAGARGRRAVGIQLGLGEGVRGGGAVAVGVAGAHAVDERRPRRGLLGEPGDQAGQVGRRTGIAELLRRLERLVDAEARKAARRDETEFSKELFSLIFVYFHN